MEVIKEIPGYKVILKAVLKMQIQQLVEQLAEHTEEESVILTASVADGTLSHLGSDSGKSFLDDHEDVKSQFLGFCLKKHHRKKQLEKEEEEMKAAQAAASVRRMRGGSLGHVVVPRRILPAGFKPVRHEPYQLTRPQRMNSSVSDNYPANIPAFQQPIAMSSPVVKTEPSDNNTDKANSDSNNMDENSSGSTNNAANVDNSTDDANVSVKLEAMTEDDLELEITGVEPGATQPNVSNVSMDMAYMTAGATGSPGDLTGGLNASFGTDMYNENGDDELHDLTNSGRNMMTMGRSGGALLSSLHPAYNTPLSFTVSEMLCKKQLRSKPTDAQLYFRTLLRDAAIQAQIWETAPLMSDIPEDKKQAFFTAFKVEPDLLRHKSELWIRLGESLQNRRKYLNDKIRGKRTTKHSQMINDANYQ